MNDTAHNSHPEIRFEHVDKILSGKKVLDDISFDIRPGEVFCIVGPSGVGKSVTLKHMVRLMTPESGVVRVGDDIVSGAEGDDLERIRERFGYLFQGGALLAWMSVFDNVALPLREKTDMEDEAICAKVRETLARVGLENEGEKMPDAVSGGMRKRAGLARAIIRDPEIILYDEPTSGLDPVTSRTIDRLVRELNRTQSITSIVVTHDLHTALSIGTRIAMLFDGKIVELATPQEFIDSQDETVQAFLASQFITREGSWERE